MATVLDRSRRPFVAGYFYPEAPGDLAREVDALLPSRGGRMTARAVIVPHGSLRFAGAVLGATMAQISCPRRWIVLAPAHTDRAVPWRLMARGSYRTPLGELPVDGPLAAALHAQCPFLTPDPWAHRGEHAIEVLVPFLQRLPPGDSAIVPIVMGRCAESERHALSRALADVVQAQAEPPLLVASAELSEGVPEADVAAQDLRWVDAMARLDLDALAALDDAGASICGLEAVRCVLEAAMRLGARTGRCVSYRTSADAGGDPNSATGYAGIVVA